MKRELLALSGALASMLACGDGRTDDPDTGVGAAGVEDTTTAPSTDLGVPTRDTAADTGSLQRR